MATRDEAKTQTPRRKAAASPSPALEPLVLFFDQLDRSSLPLAGGKAANLGELTRSGFPVPPGFCVTTRAYDAVTAGSELSGVLAGPVAASGDIAGLEALAGRAREALLRAPIPPQVEAAIRQAYATLCAGGPDVPVAVRSSATAEDLPDASFAGQQDTYLNMVGADAVVDAVRRCWASLWTDRAVAYRASNGIDHSLVKLAAVVQRMVDSAVSGVLFTANPLTNRRGEAVIDAIPGLGEALVSGMVNPDHVVVDLDPPRVVERKLAERSLAIRPRPDGGTDHVALEPGEQGAPCIDDDQALAIARMGAAIERHYQAPQDIEWAVDEQGTLWVVQSRPITTLFPLPDRALPEAFQVYFSFNMAQGVLQPLTPIGADAARRVGLGVARLFGLPADPIQGPSVAAVAAGRLFLEITPLLRRGWGRRFLTFALSHMEPRTGEVVRGLLADPRLGAPLPTSRLAMLRTLLRLAWKTKLPLRLPLTFARPGQERVAAQERVRAFLRRAAAPTSSPHEALERADRLLQDIVLKIMFQLIPSALVVGLASFGAIRRLARSFGGAEDFQRLTRGLPYNVTTEMNLALWQLSQRLRSSAADAALIGDTPPQELAARYRAGTLPAAIQREVGAFLKRYGFRGVAEIDLGVARWSDDPAHIFGMLANYMRMDDPAMAPDLQFRRAEEESAAAFERLLAAAGSGPLGAVRRRLLRLFYARMRELMGSRESPKFYAIAAFSQVRTLLRTVGEHLVREGRLEQVDDIFFLSFAEARDALYGRDQRARVAQQRAAYERELKRRRLPRVLLSDGTALYGEPPLPEGLPAGTLTGSPASPGSYTGIARVIMDPAGARLDPGEILVAPSTDPGWTPLFMTAGALVMEMGGMMSHGSVVAREYGIPAVVGVLGATGAIQSGQRITVDGERGLVILGARR